MVPQLVEHFRGKVALCSSYTRSITCKPSTHTIGPEHYGHDDDDAVDVNAPDPRLDHRW